MSNIEMENLLHYEHNLAACYEAEYLLELTMRREHISESIATNWAGYEDPGEAPIVALHQGPHTGEAVEEMDIPLTASSSCYCNHGASLQPHTTSLASTAPTEPVNIPSNHSSGNHPQFPHSPVFPTLSVVNPAAQYLTEPPTCISTVNSSALQQHTTIQYKPATTTLNGLSTRGREMECIDQSHCDGPQRKKMCLHRP